MTAYIDLRMAFSVALGVLIAHAILWVIRKVSQ